VSVLGAGGKFSPNSSLYLSLTLTLSLSSSSSSSSSFLAHTPQGAFAVSVLGAGGKLSPNSNKTPPPDMADAMTPSGAALSHAVGGVWGVECVGAEYRRPSPSRVSTATWPTPWPRRVRPWPCWTRCVLGGVGRGGHARLPTPL
jgi:hypothetical protein